MKSKRMKLFLSITIIVVLLMVGLIDIERYNYYEVPEVDMTFFDNDSEYSLVDSMVYDSYESEVVEVKYYKSDYGLNDDYDLYVALISFDIDITNENTGDKVSKYETIEGIEINTNVLSVNEDYVLVDYLMTDWSKSQKGHNITFSIDNLLGKTRLNELSNTVGYSHKGSNSVDGKFIATFEHSDYVNDSYVETLFSVAVPKGEDPTFEISYRIEYAEVSILPFSFTQKESSGDWKVISYTLKND